MNRCLHASSGCLNVPAEDRTLCEACVAEVIVSDRDEWHARQELELYPNGVDLLNHKTERTAPAERVQRKPPAKPAPASARTRRKGAQ